MIKVKICGVTNTQDALWAANLGADYVGLNFFPESPRKVSPKNAKDISTQLPPFVATVGIFVNEELSVITKLITKTPLKVVQLHGDESPEFCASVKALGVKVIKAFRLQGPLDPTILAPYQETVDFFMFDKYSAEAAGGTGETFDWAWLESAASLTKPWFLAGGLNPENVTEAIKASRPPMVDVCSGIERLPTRKDFESMKKFIQTVKAVR